MNTPSKFSSLFIVLFIHFGCQKYEPIVFDIIPIPHDSIFHSMTKSLDSASIKDYYDFYLRRFNEQLDKAKFAEAIPYGLAAYHNYTRHFPDSSFIDLHKNLSKSYMMTLNLEEGIKIAQLGINLEKSKAAPGKILGDLASNVVIAYNLQEKYGNAIPYMNLAEAVYRKTVPKSDKSVCNLKAVIGQTSIRLNQWEKSRQFLEEALVCFDSIEETDYARRANVLSGLGVARTALGDIEGGIEANTEGIKLRFSIGDTCSMPLLTLYADRGNLFSSIHELDSALANYDRALFYNDCGFIETDNLRLENICLIEGNRGNAYLQKELYQKAILSFDKALKAKGYLIGQSVPLITGSQGLITALWGKARSSFGLMKTETNRSKQIKYEKQALKYYEETIHHMVDYRNSLFEGTGRVGYLNGHKELIADAARFYLHLAEKYPKRRKKYLSRAILVSEIARSPYLFEAIKFNSPLISIRDSISSISAEISKVRNILPSADLKGKEERVAKLKEELWRQFSLEKILVDDTGTFITSLQKKSIPDDVTVLQYLLTDSSALCFLIESEGISVVKLEDYQLILDSSNQLQDLLANKSSKKEEISAISKRLYSSLIGPLEQNHPLQDKLIIIPDETLYNLPFEILETSSNVLLGDRYPVHYSFSLQIFQELEKSSKMKEQEVNFVGFAPDFSKRTKPSRPDTDLRAASNYDLPLLAYNMEEVEKVNKLLKGKSFIGPEASIDNFLSEASKADILHLATHALGDEHSISNAYFILSDRNGDYQMVENRDVQNLAIPCELVVLSACQSAKGQLSSTEGTRSLNRSFFHAGAKSVISSLWNVRDISAKILMEEFYLNLKEGKNKALALQKAKQKLRENPNFQHPYFWAGYILTGSSRPLF